MLERKTLIIGAAVLVGLIIIGAIGFFVWSAQKQEVSFEDPVDIAGDFYNAWLAAAQATTTDPYTEGLAASPILSKALRTQLKDAQKAEEGVDPVICQTTLPERTSMRVVQKNDEVTEVVVTARRSESTEQSIATLRALNGGWYIDTIRCSPGEFPPEREFSFDTEGYLLKDVPAPLNAEYWHVIFEENGVPGHFAPLFFSAESMCHARGDEPTVCDVNSFVGTPKVHVRGQMTETGVQVSRIEFI